MLIQSPSTFAEIEEMSTDHGTWNSDNVTLLLTNRRLQIIVLLNGQNDHHT